MSTTTNDDTAESPDADEETEVEKEVTVVGYARPGRWDGQYDEEQERSFLNHVDPSRDYHKTETKTHTDHYLIMEETGRRIGITQSEFRDISEDIATDAVDTEKVSVDKEIDQNQSYVNYTWRAGKAFLSSMMEPMPEEMLGLSKNSNRQSYVDEDGNDVVRFNASCSLDRVLAHRERRSEENRHDTEEYARNVTIVASLGPAAESTVEDVSEPVVQALMELLHDEDWVERVRVAECSVTREGDCFL